MKQKFITKHTEAYFSAWVADKRSRLSIEISKVAHCWNITTNVHFIPHPFNYSLLLNRMQLFGINTRYNGSIEYILYNKGVTTSKITIDDNGFIVSVRCKNDDHSFFNGSYEYANWY